MSISQGKVNEEKQDLAEFHDIGKIVNWRVLGLQRQDKQGEWEPEPHDFEKCVSDDWGIDFQSPIWEAIFRKGEASRGEPRQMVALRKQIAALRSRHFPNSARWVITSLADGLAASLRRLPEREVGGESKYARYCLWTGKTEQDMRLAKVDQLRELIAHLNGNPAWKETERRYLDVLRARAECARPGLNVSSLHAHAALAGKIYRILFPLSSSIQKRSWCAASSDAFRTRLSLFHVSVGFPQEPFRSRDLAVFRARREALEDVIAKFSDNVLVSYANNLVALFLGDYKSPPFADALLEKGFTLEVVKSRKVTLGDLDSAGIDDALRDIPSTMSYPELPDSIDPPICENCQMASGWNRWPTDYLADRSDLSVATRQRLAVEPWGTLSVIDFDEGDREKMGEWLEAWSEEFLCDRCFALRRNAPALKNLARWDDGRIAWMRIKLNLSTLEGVLRGLHAAYIKSQATRVGLSLKDMPVRLPLLADFIEDYKSMLEKWASRLRNAFGADEIEKIDEDLICVKLSESNRALQLLGIYHKLLMEHFPRLVDQDLAPISVGIVVAPAKYPFSVGWKLLEGEEAPIFVEVVGSGRARIPPSRLGDLLDLVRRADRRAYHRLREIARTSKALAELVLQDRDDRGLSSLSRILPLGLDFESLVTIANLAES